MPDSFTAKLNLTKPEVGASTDTWGTKINTDLDNIDALFDTGPYLKVSKGGTGAGTAADARTSLGVPGISTTNNFTESQTITLNTSTSGLKVIQSGAGPAIEINAGELVAGHTAPLAGISGATGVIQVNGTEGYQHASWSASNGASVQFLRSRATTPGTQTSVQENDVISSVKFAGSDGTAFVPAAEIRVAVDGTPGTNDMPGRIAFFTTADGASSVTERLRIDKSGAIGIAGANYGTAGQFLTSGGSGAAPTWSTPPSPLVQRTAIATTSGTTHEFLTIPSTVNRITVSLFGVTSGDWVGIQLGTSSGYATSGYVAGSFSQGGESSFTDGFYFRNSGDGTNGIMTITRIDSTRWVSSHAADNGAVAGGGRVQLSGQLDRIRLTAASAFSSGFVNIMYE